MKKLTHASLLVLALTACAGGTQLGGKDTKSDTKTAAGNASGSTSGTGTAATYTIEPNQPAVRPGTTTAATVSGVNGGSSVQLFPKDKDAPLTAIKVTIGADGKASFTAPTEPGDYELCIVDEAGAKRACAPIAVSPTAPADTGTSATAATAPNGFGKPAVDTGWLDMVAATSGGAKGVQYDADKAGFVVNFDAFGAKLSGKVDDYFVDVEHRAAGDSGVLASHPPGVHQIFFNSCGLLDGVWRDLTATSIVIDRNDNGGTCAPPSQWSVRVRIFQSKPALDTGWMDLAGPDPALKGWKVDFAKFGKLSGNVDAYKVDVEWLGQGSGFFATRPPGIHQLPYNSCGQLEATWRQLTADSLVLDQFEVDDPAATDKSCGRPEVLKARVRIWEPKPELDTSWIPLLPANQQTPLNALTSGYVIPFPAGKLSGNPDDYFIDIEHRATSGVGVYATHPPGVHQIFFNSCGQLDSTWRLLTGTSITIDQYDDTGGCTLPDNWDVRVRVFNFSGSVVSDTKSSDKVDQNDKTIETE